MRLSNAQTNQACSDVCRRTITSKDQAYNFIVQEICAILVRVNIFVRHARWRCFTIARQLITLPLQGEF